MKRLVHGLLVVTAALLTSAGPANGVGTPDHYLCYAARRAKDQPKLPKGLTGVLDDRFGSAQTFDLRRVTAVCNPADRDGSGVSHPTVHQEGLAITRVKGSPRSRPFTAVVSDDFAQRTLTVTGSPASLLDVTPLALGATPPASFGADPTSDPTVNRFACYKARPVRGSGKFVVPPAPLVTDDVFVNGQAFVVRKVTKLCVPVDKDGETPDAEARKTALVCYAVKLPRGTARFPKTTVATNDVDLAPHVLVATAPSELCLPATLPEKRVFVTSTSHTGALGGVAGADTICGDRATAAGLAGTFKAWLSVTGDGPAARFTQSAVPYRLVDGSVVANDWSDLIDGNLAHAINRDENGNAVSLLTEVWTATDIAGNPTPPTCNDFTDGTSAFSGVCGAAGSTNGFWTTSSTPACDLPLRLYCFEQ